MLRREMAGYAAPFELVDFMTIVENRQGPRHFGRGQWSSCGLPARSSTRPARATGPVNAMDVALRKALLKFYPELERVSLLDYKVRISGQPLGHRGHHQGADCQHRRRPYLEYGGGPAPNIMEASWTALTDSLEYFLLSNRDRT